ncbi:MAG: DUF2911 domain-containing protein [Flavobacteriaceae bacterium]
MKKLLLGVMILACSQIFAQVATPQPSPFSKTEQMVGLTKVNIDYSRPAARGRAIFGELVPFGKLWRTGANANTVIGFSDDVKIGDQELKKGNYALYSVPNKDSWDLIFYTDTSNWGTPRTWDDSKVAAKISAKSQEIPWPMNSFTIMIDELTDNSAMVNIMWEQTMVQFSISVPTEQKAMASIEREMKGPSAQDYNASAAYLLSVDKELETALEYSEKAVELNPNAYWMARTLSLIQAKLGKKKDAIKTAKMSLELAEKAGNQDYVRMNKNSIEEWSK